MAALAAAMLGGVVACRSRPLPFVPVTAATGRFEMLGFSVLPPRGPRWYVVRQAWSSIEFTKDTGKAGRHTVNAVALSAALDPPVTTPEDLHRFTTAMAERDYRNPRFRLREMRVEAVDSLGTPCEQIYFSAEDRGVPYALGQVFVMQGWDLVCVHPQGGGRVLVRLGASQRHLESDAPLDLEPELTPFIKSLVFGPLR
jgi:hypothetical protein